MFHQRVSEICLEETVVATTCRSAADAKQSHGFAEPLSTGRLAAMAEAMCIREMTPHVDPTEEVVVHRPTDGDHRRPVLPGTLLHVRGWVEQIGKRNARLLVSISDADAVVCEARITLMAVARPARAVRIATCSGAVVDGSAVAARHEREFDDALSRTWRHRADPTPQGGRAARSAFQRSVFSSRAASSAK